MKLLLAVLVLCPTSSRGSSDSSQFDCAVSVAPGELEYIKIARSVGVKMRFSSNCLRLRDFSFEAYFSFRHRLTAKRHPKAIELLLLGNRYLLQFSEPVSVAPKAVLRRLSYSRVQLATRKQAKSTHVELKTSPVFLLEEQRPGSFSKRNLKRLLLFRNPVRCRIKPGNAEMRCKIL